MSRRPALVTQADVARAIRAAKAEGLTILRIVVRPDRVAIEVAPDVRAASLQEDDEDVAIL